MTAESTTWGYILEAPGRPSIDQQRLSLGALGVDLGEFGTLWQDNVARGSTRPQHQLAARNDLIRAVASGDTVAVCAPFCLGLSAADAGWFLGELAARGVTVLVNGDLTKVAPGGDVTALVAEVARRQNTLHSVRSQRKKRGLPET